MKNGDLVKLSLHGRMMTGNANITDSIGIIINDNLDWEKLVRVKWFTTGKESNTHIDFIEKLEEK
jgi:RNA-binding protein YhbY